MSDLETGVKARLTMCLLMVVLGLLPACHTLGLSQPGVDITREAFLEAGYQAEEIYRDSTLEVWRSRRSFYYFRQGRLERIEPHADQPGSYPTQRIAH